jgi:hypothetical protein
VRVISASRRTDIPAFYSKWFANRLEAGFCHWINPFGGQVYRVSLKPEDCLAIVFWTRNPQPLLPHLHSLEERGMAFYFHYTINGYPPELETHSPLVGVAVEQFQRLSDVIGPHLVHWRYDPIILSSCTSVDYHAERFAALSRQLEGYTERCYFSFLDLYGKTARNLRRVAAAHGVSFDEPSLQTRRLLSGQLMAIASDRHMVLLTCCGDELIERGIQKAHCVDAAFISTLCSSPDLGAGLKAAPTRTDCGCAEATDIGAYDTCIFGCSYCYATNSRRAALARLQAHDSDDSVLWRPSTLVDVDLTALEQPASERSRRTDGHQAPGSAQPPLF